MSSPYWDGLYSREEEPPPGLTGVDREGWLRGKEEAAAIKAAQRRPRSKVQASAANAPRRSLAAWLARPGSWNSTWRVGLMVALGSLLTLYVGLAPALRAAVAAGWLLFAATVVWAAWHLAGQEITNRKNLSALLSSLKAFFQGRRRPQRPPAG